MDNPAPAIPTARRRWFQWAPGWFCAISPWVLLVLLLSLAAHVRLGLGHWPQPMFEDYRTPGFDIHSVAVAYFACFTALVSGPLWCVFLLIPPLRPASKRIAGWQLLTAALGCLVIYLAVTYDPTHFVDWFLD